MVAEHGGASYDAARATARVLLNAGRRPASRLDGGAALVEKTLAGYGEIPRAAMTRATAIAGDPALRDEAAVLGAAVAVGQMTAASEAVLIAAITVGRELRARLCESVGENAFGRIWNADAALGVFGAVAVAARVLSLSAEQARHALGLAATQSAGIALTTGAAAGIAIGKAAADGIEAAVLASHGFTSSAASIEGRRGFAALMATTFDPAAIVDALGESWTA
jgi:2-methylcitrate dehydratase PrpD